MDLKTANFDRLNQDVIEDLKRVMKMKESNGKIEYDMFADLMQKTEVQYLTVFFMQASLELVYYGSHNTSFGSCG